ncbi:MAG: phosphoribosylamine--glycine ligase [Deltaproteobacteria bacterium]|jgi:phosphoribosylamine--glycine ligase|nr:phosphoribosylamine--glycine ligase [Deltaproteobacteria bacterium]
MKILLIGSGGREHALAWKLTQNPNVVLHSAPGNPGMGALGQLHPVNVDDIDGIKKLALAIKPDLVVIGPEIPLVMGLADVLRDEGILVFGPSKLAARIEGSKVFAKDFMIRHSLPTANYAVFYDEAETKTYLQSAAYPIVLKADGLAAGKGVVVCGKYSAAINALSTLAATQAGKKIIVEEFIAGDEVSFLGITDGKTILPLPSAQDHKTIYEEDRGPNTGGMGAYAPAPLVNEFLHNYIMENILQPAVDGLTVEGSPFVGVLYAGLMVSLSGPRLLEFNARFGDPETQAIMPLIKSDLAPVLLAAAKGDLEGQKLELSNRSAVSIVMSAEGYPGPFRQNDVIEGIEKANARKDVIVFQAGVGTLDGLPVTKGGRVLNVTAVGDTLRQAVDLAYTAVGDISFKGAHYRKDIGSKAFRGSPLSENTEV